MSSPIDDLINERAVIVDGVIDIAATLANLERGLEFYERELRDMRAFQRAWNAEWSDVTDKREQYEERCATFRGAIAKLKAQVSSK